MTIMTQHDREYDLLRRHECQTMAADVFHLGLKIDNFLCDDIETGDDSYAILFRSGKDVYALLVNRSEAPQTLGDVQDILKGMGLSATIFYPPYADERYFYRQAVAKLEETYPARRQWSLDDVHQYTRYAVYDRALVKIGAVNDGMIRRFNRLDRSWQDAFRYSFRKVEVVHG